MNTLGSTRMVTQLATLNPSEGATEAITAIAAARSTSRTDRELAKDALKNIRSVSAGEIERVVNAEEVSRSIDEVILHHTWRPRMEDYRGIESIIAMSNFAIRTLGWKHVGWHYAVAPSGEIWLGRPLAEPGSNARGKNSNSIGVELILDGDVEVPSAAQIGSLTQLLQALFKRFNIEASHNFAPGRGFHRDYSPGITCPGELITKEAVLGWLASRNYETVSSQ